MIIHNLKSHKAATIIIFIIISLFTIARQFSLGSWHAMQAMHDFMAGFFLIFGSFKLIDLPGFVVAYKKYNLLAEHITAYAYATPFIQIGLGISYLFSFHMLATNSINFVMMGIGFISVLIKIVKKEIIPCACLGTIFKHPLSLMSLFEQALMVVISASMVLYHYYRMG